VFDPIRVTLQRDGHAAQLLMILTATVAVLLIAIIVVTIALVRQRRSITALTRGMDGVNLEETLVRHLETVQQTLHRIDAIEQALAVLQAQMPGCLQRAHLIRYDAFEDVGGEQSFSLALTNQHGDGIVLTSVYSRMDVRVYAKSIQNGRASHALSNEEERLLRELNAR